MPLPLILGIGAAIAGAAGIGSGIHGAVKMKEASDTIDVANYQHKRNVEKFEKVSDEANQILDTLGKLELEILRDFEFFSDTIEKIQNRPVFEEYNKNGIKLPSYDREKLKEVSVGAGVLLGGLESAAAGTAGGFAAAGAVTVAVNVWGTASTGAAIGSLSGIAATNATLAVLGGGALAAGGGGMALGTTILGATTLGVGLLVGGVIFNVTGSKLSDKADEAYRQMKKAEEKINKACEYLNELASTGKRYIEALKDVRRKFAEIFTIVSNAIYASHKVNWCDFTYREKKAVENSTLLVGLLYNMCKVNLVNKSKNEDDINTVNHSDINKSISESVQLLGEVA